MLGRDGKMAIPIPVRIWESRFRSPSVWITISSRLGIHRDWESRSLPDSASVGNESRDPVLTRHRSRLGVKTPSRPRNPGKFGSKLLICIRSEQNTCNFKKKIFFARWAPPPFGKLCELRLTLRPPRPGRCGSWPVWVEKTRFQIFLSSFVTCLAFLRPKNANLTSFSKVLGTLSPKSNKVGFLSNPVTRFLCAKNREIFFPSAGRPGPLNTIRNFCQPVQRPRKNDSFQENMPKNPFFCKCASALTGTAANCGTSDAGC